MLVLGVAQGLIPLMKLIASWLCRRRREHPFSAKFQSKALSSFWCSRFCGVKGLFRRLYSGSLGVKMDFLRCDDDNDDRSHEGSRGADHDRLLLVALLSLAWRVGVVVGGVSLLLVLPDDCPLLRLDLNLLKTMVTIIDVSFPRSNCSDVD